MPSSAAIDDSEEQRVKRAIVDAVVENYDLIAQSQEANRRVEAVSGAAQAESNKLRESLAKLQAQSKGMMQAGSVWRRKKQVLGSAVAQHQKLLALAEAPALAEECIKGEMYHEALLVMEHMMRSDKYAQQHVGFFVRANDRMREAVDRSLDEVVLPRLSGPLSVDAAFKIATFLRRLGTGTDRLKAVFLEHRSVFLDRLVAEAGSSPAAYSRMLRSVNVYKVHVGEVVMQYCACFPSASAGAGREAAGAVDGWDDGLRVWCHAQAGRFVALFAATMRDITNGSELALVVEQCTGCSASVSKLHMDVAPLLNGIIIGRVREVFAAHMSHALSAYSASMCTFSWRMPPSYGPSSSTAAASHEDGTAGSPPLVLAQWLPLAYALNGLLTAFNAVRKCLVPGVELFCVEHTVALVARVAADLLRDGELAGTMEEAERGVYRDLATAFVSVFYPHVVACTRKLLGVEPTLWLEAALADTMSMLSRRLPAPTATPAPQPMPQRHPMPAHPAPSPASVTAAPSPAPVTAAPVPAPPQQQHHQTALTAPHPAPAAPSGPPPSSGYPGVSVPFAAPAPPVADQQQSPHAVPRTMIPAPAPAPPLQQHHQPAPVHNPFASSGPPPVQQQQQQHPFNPYHGGAV